ncbi:ABC transporter permease [Paenibacillus allorhizosphaerae]|uniref:Multiple-sugar transport system permease YteP n=1 Tax=Paenibacillus allorhizosphaerae TaxID=2849866 RepID=A0ABN7U1E9_9BACL|nr:sugar ABC transporter permease [Paenibacillus allorhizosphaerae]CAG7658970.1 putative multiple-sugar transport system permease YteP [Paenibacillus allorhizosphaerae]
MSEKLAAAHASPHPSSHALPRPKANGLRKCIKRDKYLYLMLIPIVAYYLIFKYAPMLGEVIAFKNYRFADGILGSEWVGLKHFRKLLSSPDFFNILRNTLLLNVYSVVFGFPVPILLALLLNEVRNEGFKRIIQNLLYVPHFISWVVLGGIINTLLSPSTGVVNFVLHHGFGMEPIYFLANPFWWPVMFVLSGIWHSAGWNTILYMAAITGIDPQLYEAARMDGAGRLSQIWHITLPGIRSTIAVLLILRMGYMMDIGFEQIFVLQNTAVLEVADVISTYVYRMGLQHVQYSYTTALGLFQSVIGLILVISMNRIVKLLGERGLW